MPNVLHIPLHSPLVWIGGKSRLAHIIVPIINQQSFSTYVEPFAGGASVFFYKAPSKTEVLNDINGELIKFYKKIQQKATPCSVHDTREEFWQSKAKVKSGTWNVCDYIRYNKDSFAGGFRTYGKSTNCDQKTGNCHVTKYNQQYPKIQQRLQKVKLHNRDYTEMIKRYDTPNTFFYVDPPYEGESSKEYRTDLSSVSPEKIAAAFCHTQGKVLISINDSPNVRSVFENKCNYSLKTLQVFYSANSRYPRVKPELLITNFPLK